MSRREYRETSRTLGALFPLVGSTNPPCNSVPIGASSSGGVFCYDPFELYSRGFLQSPNMVVLGQLGKGKSSLVKSLIVRSAALGRSYFVLDPKGEYGELARETGGALIRLEVGGDCPVDPFWGTTRSDERDALAIESTVTRLLEGTLGRTLDTYEQIVLDQLLLERYRLGAAFDLLELSALAASDEVSFVLDRKGCDPYSIARARATISRELQRLVRGDLRGLIAAKRTAKPNLEEGVVIDLSALYGSKALSIAIGLLMEMRLRQLRDGGVARGYVVIDEAWAVLENPAIASWFRFLWKLARAYGSSNIAVTHRLSDLVEMADPAVRSQAAGLLADSETFVVYSQPRSQAEETGRYLGLGRGLTLALPQLERGSALWQVGRDRYIVRHVLSAVERRAVDTDAAMRDRAGRVSGR